jgi:hypothetical protein
LRREIGRRGHGRRRCRRCFGCSNRPLSRPRARRRHRLAHQRIGSGSSGCRRRTRPERRHLLGGDGRLGTTPRMVRYAPGPPDSSSGDWRRRGLDRGRGRSVDGACESSESSSSRPLNCERLGFAICDLRFAICDLRFAIGNAPRRIRSLVAVFLAPIAGDYFEPWTFRWRTNPKLSSKPRRGWRCIQRL